MIITVDGPAGAGKSTIAKKLAQKLGFLYVDTGAMYRAFTLKALNDKVNFADIDRLVFLARETNIQLKQMENNEIKVLLDGEDVSGLIRTPELTNAVFKVAQIPQIREVMVQWQRSYGESNNIVMEGRDIGTVVFPQADEKFYLDADINIRAERRYNELKEKGIDVDMHDLLEQMKARDYKDKNRSSGPLKKADDAILIDSTGLSIEEVVDTISSYINDEKRK
ncbi:MAG: (d)CMP kinase [PVC group bacterium]|nr:(d)CMP kinase [PVC group bacterium]